MPGLEEAIEGWAELVTFWADQWKAYAQGVAGKTSDPQGYTADDAVNTMKDGATLAFWTLAGAVNEVLDTAAVLAVPVKNRAKSAPNPIAAATFARSMAISADLKRNTGEKVLTASVIFDVQPLPAGATSFKFSASTLTAAGVSLPSGFYSGKATASPLPNTGGSTTTVDAFIVIP